MKKLLLILLIASGCSKVDNSELCQVEVKFLNLRSDTIKIHLQTGSVLTLNPKDSINNSCDNDQPTLTMTFTAFYIKDNRVEYLFKRNVQTRNEIR